MWKIHYVILTILFSDWRPVFSFQDGTGAASGTGRKDPSLLGLLSGNGLYNPMDPMGFIFEGNSEQFTGNGADTPRFDPDNFAYRYAGTTFGSDVKPFVSNFISSQSINNSPNYAHTLHPTKPPIGVHNETNRIGGKNETKTDAHTFSELPAADGSYPSGAFLELASQTFPENIMSTLKINASNMFPGVKFSGQPGMLGIGSQTPVQTVIPEAGPVPDQQYLPAALRNVSETRMSSLAYNRYPGMEGDKLQTSFGTNSINTSTQKPLYNGYPGMLGVGQMFNNIGSKVNEPIGTNGGDNFKGYSNKDQPGYQNVIGNKFISAIPAGGNANNWKGEWPGKTSAGGDWSGDWSEKWHKSNSQKTKDKEGTLASKFGNSASQPSSNTDWDGSWPGSDEKAESTTKSSNNFGDLGETMAALEKLMNMLNNIPASVDNSNDNKAAPKSFSQMVSSWKEEMKS